MARWLEDPLPGGWSAKDFKVSRQRGQFVESPLAPFVFATLHPSALLRVHEEEEREAAFKQFVKGPVAHQKGLPKGQGGIRTVQDLFACF
jgi:hypothetical protein